MVCITSICFILPKTLKFYETQIKDAFQNNVSIEDTDATTTYKDGGCTPRDRTIGTPQETGARETTCDREGEGHGSLRRGDPFRPGEQLRFRSMVDHGAVPDLEKPGI